MSTFRDATARAIVRGFHPLSHETHRPMPEPERVDFHLADAVLDMPEMQAIRKALREVDRYWWIEGNWDRGEWLRTSAELPESVIAWVLDGES